MQQILTGISEALKKLMDNENRSAFNLVTQRELLERCLQESSLMVRRCLLYNALQLAKQEVTLEWQRFTAKALAAVQLDSVESRYCGVLQPVRTLPAFVDRLVQAQAACKASETRLQAVLRREGPVKNQLRQLHAAINAALPAEVTTVKNSQDLEEGGFGVLLLLTKKIQGEVTKVAERKAKYSDLIRMENYNFLYVSLRSRQVKLLEPFVASCDAQYCKVKEEEAGEA